MERRRVVEAVANIDIFLKGGVEVLPAFARFFVQSINIGKNQGRRLYINDHRIEVICAARKVKYGSLLDRKSSEKELEKTIRKPARVEVMEKIEGNKRFYYINLYQKEENIQKCTSLLSVSSCSSKNNAEFEVKLNNALWSWKSVSSSSNGYHKEILFLTLTDEVHKVEIESSGYANNGNNNKNLTVITIIDSQKRRFAEEKEFLSSVK